jgi:4-hydroxybenzoate polyprenyltransferase
MSEIAAASPVVLMARDIKLSHSVFALPFAVLGAVLSLAGAAGTRAGSPSQVQSAAVVLSLVVVCMVSARTWAMLVNRLVDRGFDAGNARTARRVFASGAVSARTGWMTAFGAAGLFAAATGGFGLVGGNWWPVILAGPVLAWIAFYSWTKRFTWWCHVVLGSALAASPLAAAIAVDPGAVGLPGLGGHAVGAMVPAVWWLAGFVLCWVAGFDVIYALQDVEFDRGRGLRSVPASLGVGTALWISRVLHAMAAGLLVLAWRSDARFGFVFGAGVALACGLLVLEHVVLAKRGKAGLEMAFFTINGVVSVVVGAAGCVDVVG